MCGVLKSLLDSLVSEMSDRFSRLRDLNSQFGFLLNTKSLLLQQVPHGADDIDTELRSQCLHFDKIYGNDVRQRQGAVSGSLD